MQNNSALNCVQFFSGPLCISIMLSTVTTSNLHQASFTITNNYQKTYKPYVSVRH